VEQEEIAATAEHLKAHDPLAGGPVDLGDDGMADFEGKKQCDV
jgi:hypothetical protein